MHYQSFLVETYNHWVKEGRMKGREVAELQILKNVTLVVEVWLSVHREMGIVN